MPKKTLAYANELNKSKYDIYTGYDNNLGVKLIIKKEQEFISLCQEVSQIDAFIQSIPDFLNDESGTKLDKELENIVAYITFLSNQEDLQLLVLDAVCLKVLSLLDEEQQKKFINILILKNNIDLVFDLIKNNNYIQFIPELKKNIHNIKEENERYKYYALLSYFKDEEYYSISEKAFIKEINPYFKYDFAKELIKSPINGVWKYFQNNMKEGRDLEGGIHLGLFASPTDINYFKEAVTYHWENTKALVNIASSLTKLGSSAEFNWYLEVIKHPDIDVRKAFHVLMLKFFQKNDEIMKPGWEFQNLEDDEKNTFLSSEMLVLFWESKKNYILQTLDPKIRYWNAKAFDLEKIFYSYSSKNDILELENCVYNFQVWTGCMFEYDPNAFYEKRFLQLENINNWILKNKKQFTIGKWYRWGKEVH